MNLNQSYIKGDSFTLQGKINQDITDWKIRCQISDGCGHQIKLATANTGGDDTQIEITDLVNGIFLIKVEADLTTEFDNIAKIEIEVETNTDVGSKKEKITILQSSIKFDPQNITWETPEE